MGEDYLLARKSALLARADETDPNIKETVEQLAETIQALGVSGGGSGGSVDISTLAKEATLDAIKTKILGSIAVTLAPFNLTPDYRLLTTDTTIPAGSNSIFMKVILGDVTINGLTFSTGEYINFESSHPARHGAISLVIPVGKSVRLVREY